jgi:hypothetical protein
MCSQGFGDASLPSDIGIGSSAELKECINDKADNMEAVCYYLGIGEKSLHKAAEGRAQIHADNLNLIATGDFSELRFKYRCTFTFKDFIDAMMFQISQSDRKFMAFSFASVNTMFINAKNQRTGVIERFSENLIELLVHDSFDGGFGDAELPGNVFIAYAA